MGATAGEYAKTLTLDVGAVTGPTTLTVRMALADGGLEKTLTLDVDKTPPVVVSHDAGVPPGRPTNWVQPSAWRRDEAPEVEVVFNKAMSTATLAVGARRSRAAAAVRPAASRRGCGGRR